MGTQLSVHQLLLVNTEQQNFKPKAQPFSHDQSEIAKLHSFRNLFRAFSGNFKTMAWRCGGKTNAELIENLFKNNLITSSRVRDAMLNVDRAHYCPDPEYAYEDSPQSIGHAAAVELHQELVDQLRSPGRIFIPVEDARGGGQYIWVVDKDANGSVTKKKTYGVRYVPLTDAPK